MDEAKSWLRSAELNMDGSNYSKSVYALEMSLEIALKSVLVSASQSATRQHDVLPQLEGIILLKPKLLSAAFKQQFEHIVPVFRQLLALRLPSAYGYEATFSEDDFRHVSEECYDLVEKMISTCEKEIKRTK